MHNMKRMKIRIEDPCGYEGLEGATFPLILDAKLGDKGLAYVRFSTMMQVEGWFKEACALLIKSDNPYFKNIKDAVEPKQEEPAANFKHYAIVKGMNVQLVSHSYEEIATEAKKMKEEYPISTVEIYERIGVVSIEPTAVIK